MLDVFEAAMAEPAGVIIRERKKIVGLLKDIADQTYANISGNPDERFQIHYHCGVGGEKDEEESFLAAVREKREEDIRFGMTSVGPHRDDLILIMNRKSMKGFASQGQVRTAALSMKLAQMKILRDFSGDQPVILLDDVMSELDKNRRMRLIDEINHDQTFITCTDESDLDPGLEKRVYQVRKEADSARIELKYTGSRIPEVRLSEPDFSL